MNMIPLKVYVADTTLIPAAQIIVEVTRKMVGKVDTPVDIEVATFPHPSNYTWANSLTQAGTLQPIWSTGFITTGTGTTTVPSNLYNTPWTGTATTTTLPPNYTINIGTGSGAPLTPDQVPASQVFEDMLLASIKQLNEAYNLGRLHGYVQGKEEGALAEHKATQDAMDTDILEPKDGIYLAV